MRCFGLTALLILVGCNAHDLSEARDCGLSEDELREAIKGVAKMAPYSGRESGRCDLIVDDAGNVSVITPEIQRSVDEMMAREEAAN